MQHVSVFDSDFYKIAFQCVRLDISKSTWVHMALRGDLQRVEEKSELVHVVKSGDTLSSIAWTYLGDAAKWSWVREVNPQIENPDRIEIGDEIVIPVWAPKRYRMPVKWWDSSRYYQFGDLYESGPYEGLPHPGLDLPGFEGEPVYCIGDGYVERNLPDADGYGHVIVVWHVSLDGPSFWSLYAHLMPGASPKEGQRVFRGEQIGKMGHTGTSVTHLHWELKRVERLGLYTGLPGNLYIAWEDPRLFVLSAKNLYRPL